ncbi:MAG: hypothetical protein GX838_06395 [Clostridiaceae bacterium]|nr:hypothetical protein [Clostridiaceae bacterium]
MFKRKASAPAMYLLSTDSFQAQEEGHLILKQPFLFLTDFFAKVISRLFQLSPDPGDQFNDESHKGSSHLLFSISLPEEAARVETAGYFFLHTTTTAVVQWGWFIQLEWKGRYGL